MAELLFEGLPGPPLLHNKLIPIDAADIAPEDARSIRTMTTLADRISRPWVFDGQPAAVKKRAWSLKINRGLTSDQFQHLLWIDALPGFFDFCVWTYEVETFAWPDDETILPLSGGHRCLVSWRRDALVSAAAYAPPDIATQFPSVAYVDGVLDTNPTFASSDPLGRTLWYPSIAPEPCSDTNMPNIMLLRIPLFRAYVDHSTSSTPDPTAIDRTFVIREA